MCFITNYSKYPWNFIAYWIPWCLIDLFLAIFAYMNQIDDNTCQNPNIIFDLSYWLIITGILGLAINLSTITIEINSYHISNKLAILLRIILSLLSLIWVIVGIFIFIGLQQKACQTEYMNIYCLAMTGLTDLLLNKCILIHISTNYSYCQKKPVLHV